jgi:hypothetical protein
MPLDGAAATMTHWFCSSFEVPTPFSMTWHFFVAADVLPDWARTI